jgi:hypothetical protein
MNYPSYGQFNQYTNPLMQQLAMMKQGNQNPYSKTGREVGYMPVNPFGLKRPKRKLNNVE